MPPLLFNTESSANGMSAFDPKRTFNNILPRFAGVCLVKAAHANRASVP